MNNNLVICPTYNRPEQFVRMIDSFYRTSKCSDLVMLTRQGSITALINSVQYDKYDFISVTNDDFIYHTYGWDEILIDHINRKGFGFAFGNDGTNNKHLPATCIMSASIPRALGWIQLPGLEHLCGDMVWQYIGKKLECLYYLHNVKIEHMHFLFKKGNESDYERTNSKEMYQRDNATFREWVRERSEEDIEKIRNYLGLC